MRLLYKVPPKTLHIDQNVWFLIFFFQGLEEIFLKAEIWRPVSHLAGRAKCRIRYCGKAPCPEHSWEDIYLTNTVRSYKSLSLGCCRTQQGWFQSLCIWHRDKWTLKTALLKSLSSLLHQGSAVWAAEHTPQLLHLAGHFGANKPAKDEQRRKICFTPSRTPINYHMNLINETQGTPGWEGLI